MGLGLNRVGSDEEGEEARLAALERREAHVVHLRSPHSHLHIALAGRWTCFVPRDTRVDSTGGNVSPRCRGPDFI